MNYVHYERGGVECPCSHRHTPLQYTLVASDLLQLTALITSFAVLVSDEPDGNHKHTMTMLLLAIVTVAQIPCFMRLWETTKHVEGVQNRGTGA